MTMQPLPTGELIFDTDPCGQDYYLLTRMKLAMHFAEEQPGTLDQYDVFLKKRSRINSHLVQARPIRSFNHLEETIQNAAEAHSATLGIDNPDKGFARLFSSMNGGTLVILGKEYAPLVLMVANGLAASRANLDSKLIEALKTETPDESNADIVIAEGAIDLASHSFRAAAQILYFYGITATDS